MEESSKQVEREQDINKFTLLSNKVSVIGLIVLFIIFAVTNDVTFYIKLISLGVFWIIWRLFDLQKAVQWILEDLIEIKRKNNEIKQKKEK